MSRIHDMGGRYGDGVIHPEPQDAPIFAQDWHARALALTLACGALGQWNIDMSRHARECLSPSDYMNFGYYEKWLAALADLLVAQGVLSRADLSAVSDTPDTIHPLAARHLPGARRGGACGGGTCGSRQHRGCALSARRHRAHAAKRQ